MFHFLSALLKSFVISFLIFIIIIIGIGANLWGMCHEANQSPKLRDSRRPSFGKAI
jgi:hypothetical protein